MLLRRKHLVSKGKLRGALIAAHEYMIWRNFSIGSQELYHAIRREYLR